eukprot:1041089-Prorocentrum_minimum.AAC.1
MRLLGCVILSFGFLIFEERRLVQTNFAEIFGAMTAASLFSLIFNLAAGRTLVRAPSATPPQPPPHPETQDLTVIGPEE